MLQTDDVSFWFKFGKAVDFAALCHRNQVRRGRGVPFIAHPLAVASLVLENSGCNDSIIAALLHDVIEDTGVSPERIEVDFGRPVMGIVVELTRPPINWKQINRKDVCALLTKSRGEYAEKMRAADARVQIVCAADKLHNARSIFCDLVYARDEAGEGKKAHEIALAIVNIWNRFIGRRELTIKYFLDMAEVFSESESADVRHLGRLLLGTAQQMQTDF